MRHSVYSMELTGNLDCLDAGGALDTVEYRGLPRGRGRRLPLPLADH